MITKYYSELLNKEFKTEKECLDAENTFNAQKEAEEKAKKEQANLASKEKKELSKAVEDAVNNLSKAYKVYEDKQQEANKLYETYVKQVNELLRPAKEEIKKAQQAKYEAIAEYNKKYGTYTYIYNGDKALDEFKRVSGIIDTMFENFWS